VNEVKEGSEDLALTVAQRQEIASARMELTKALDEMVKAIASNRTLQTQAGKLKEKGRLATAWGSISGANDRDLATMVKELGGSLETTQKAVQVVLRLQSRKDHVLREFHGVLIEKIQKIKADTRTLDANQQAAVDVLCDFQEQIEDQLQHHEAVERHELKIAELTAELTSKENELKQGLQALDNQVLSLRATSEHLTNEIDVLKKKIEAADIAREKAESYIDELKSQYVSEQERVVERINKMSGKQNELFQHLQQLSLQIAEQSTLKGWLTRNATALVAVGMSGLALAQTMLR
jgi:phage shock protein A